MKICPLIFLPMAICYRAHADSRVKILDEQTGDGEIQFRLQMCDYSNGLLNGQVGLSLVHASPIEFPRCERTRLQSGIFDLFLCHNSEDKPAIREIAQRLVMEGTKP